MNLRRKYTCIFLISGSTINNRRHQSTSICYYVSKDRLKFKYETLHGKVTGRLSIIKSDSKIIKIEYKCKLFYTFSKTNKKYIYEKIMNYS